MNIREGDRRDRDAILVLHPPHAGRLLYERRFGFSRERFAAAALPFIQERIVGR